MRYHFKIHRENDSYWAEGIELDGCVTQGETLKELESNLHEVLNLYLAEPDNSPIIFPFPDATIIKDDDIIEIQANPEILFSKMLRQYRLKHNLTQKQVAQKMGMKNIYSYQRLERRSNPNLKTLSKLKKVFPDFSAPGSWAPRSYLD